MLQLVSSEEAVILVGKLLNKRHRDREKIKKETDIFCLGFEYHVEIGQKWHEFNCFCFYF